MKTNIYIDGTDARAAFGVWVVRGGGPAGPSEFGRVRTKGVFIAVRPPSLSF